MKKNDFFWPAIVVLALAISFATEIRCSLGNQIACAELALPAR